MLARTGGSEGATEGCGSLLPWHWPRALVVEQLTAALELFGRQLRQNLREVAADGGSERGSNYRGNSSTKRTQANNRTPATAIAIAIACGATN
jgi:hypothetical protein